MQYLLEETNGVRMPITEDQAAIARQMKNDKGKPFFDVRKLTNDCTLFVDKRKRRPMPRALKYGGPKECHQLEKLQHLNREGIRVLQHGVITHGAGFKDGKSH